MKILTLWLLNAAILSCAAAQANDSTAKSFDPDQFSPGRLPINQLIAIVSSKNGPDARKLLDKNSTSRWRHSRTSALAGGLPQRRAALRRSN
jgi:hypothetical protein